MARPTTARTASTILYRWTEPDWPDIAAWKEGRMAWAFRGVPSRKAFWAFEAAGEYRPSPKVADGRVLVAFDFGPQAETVVKDPARRVRFPSGSYLGETKHPWGVVWKDNERGGYGIGAELLRSLVVVSIRLATKPEIADALGCALKDVVLPRGW